MAMVPSKRQSSREESYRGCLVMITRLPSSIYYLQSLRVDADMQDLNFKSLHQNSLASRVASRFYLATRMVLCPGPAPPRAERFASRRAAAEVYKSSSTDLVKSNVNATLRFNTG